MTDFGANDSQQRRRPARSPGVRWALAIAATVGLGGCVIRELDRGKELGHTYRGAPMNDAPAATGQGQGGQGSASAEPVKKVPVSKRWMTKPVEPVFDAGSGPPLDPKPVNIFGEMDGLALTPAKHTGDAGYQQHTFIDEGGDSDVAVDPTGKWLVFASTRHSEHTDIYLQRTDGTAVTQLTSDAADDAYPCFSPDGKQIAFASTRAGSWQIYVMDTDGRNVVQVTNGMMQCVHPSFSPDGTRLAYSAIGSRSNQWELWVADLRTNEKRMIGYGLFPRWSPDRSVDRIAYQKARQRGGRWFSLWTLDLIEGEGRRMTEVAASTNAAIVSPCWSPEGRRLTFATVIEPARAQVAPAKSNRPGPEQPAAPCPKAQQDVWTINADGSNRQRLTDGNGSNLSPYWAPDNRIYFVSDRGGNECVWSVRADSAHSIDVAGAAHTPPPAEAARAPAAGHAAPPASGPANVFADPSDADR